MAFNGAGVFSRLYSWITDAANGVKISSTRMDAEMDGMATGLTTALCKDGQSTCSARIPFAAGVGLSDGTVSVPAINFTSDADNGFYRIGTNNWAASAGGVKAWEVDASARFLVATKLGINMTPTNVVDIDQSASNAGAIAKLNNAHAGAAAFSSFQAHNGTAAVNLYMIGTGYTPSGVARASGALLDAAGAGGLTLNTSVAQPIYFGTNGTQRMILNTSGQIILNAGGSIGTIGSTAGTALTGTGEIYGSSTTNSTMARMSSDGTVVSFRRDTTDVGSVSVTTTATSYNTSSDAILKEDTKPAAEVGHFIDSAVVSEFNWKETGEKQIAGFVAQDLLDTLAPQIPGLVHQRDDGLLEYDPSKLVPLLFREVQSLRSRLAAAGVP